MQNKLTTFLNSIQEIIPESGLETLQNTTKPLKIKFGADPSAPDLHLGHTVILTKLRLLQEMGHTIQFLIGDFTARIGDPTGKSETRKPLSAETIAQNAKSYQSQVFKILDKSKTTVVYNSEWLDKLTAQDLIGLAAKYTVARMLERDDFHKRFKSEQAISVHEFLYPLLQGYDSVVLESDVEIGGTDQKFNLLMGRHLQREFGKKPQLIITVPLLEGTDGIQKMSKSLNNHIGIMESPKEMFGKIMSIPDTLLIKYHQLLTDTSPSELHAMADAMQSNTINPRDIKVNLALHLVEKYHSRAAANEAQAEFELIFKQKETPETMPELLIPNAPIRLDTLLSMASLTPSKKEAARLIKQGAVDINETTVTDPFQLYQPKTGDIIKVGKRRFVRIKIQ